MPKTGGDITKKRILDIAEKLFSEKGFDGTGMEEIARKTGINKATIYYHFKNKNDIIEALFKNIIIDLNNFIKASEVWSKEGSIENNMANKVGLEIKFIEKKKKIISILIMESLKSNDKNNFIFQCAELIINNELKMHSNGFREKKSHHERDKQEFYVYEFFTGFIPFMMFIAFKDKYCNYFNFDEEEVFNQFLESFKRSHISSHM